MATNLIEKLNLTFNNFRNGLMSTPSWVYLLGFLLLNLALKLPFINYPAFGMDEPFTLFRAQMQYPELLSQLADNNHPPLFESIMWVWLRVVGYNEILLRLIPLFFHLCTVLSLFYIVAKHSHKMAAFWSVLLFSLSNMHLYFSHEIRSYTLFALLTIWTIHALIILVQKPNWQRALGLSVCYILLMYTHYFGAFVLLGQMVMVLLWQFKKLWRYYLFAGLIFLLAYGWQIHTITHRLASRGSVEFWLSEPGIPALFNQLRKFCNSSLSVLVALGLLGWLAIKNRSLNTRTKWLIRSGAALFPITYVAMWLIAQEVTLFHDRYLSYTTIGLFILLGVALGEKSHVAIRQLTGILLVISMILGLNLKPNHRQPYHEIAAFLQHPDREGYTVFSSPRESFIQLGYHVNIDHFKDYESTRELLKNDGWHFESDIEAKSFASLVKKGEKVAVVMNEKSVGPLMQEIRAHPEMQLSAQHAFGDYIILLVK